jgi:aspartokinase-like uncharacterized kinase
MAQPPAINILIAGGGKLVDAIRDTIDIHSMTDESAHWLCIDAMSVTSRLLTELLIDSERITEFDDLRRRVTTSTNLTIVFDPNEFLQNHESQQPGHLLPHNWAATSDSIAARLAEVLSADELVLLKSADPPASEPRVLADLGYVDQHFPAFSSSDFQYKFVNLRSALEPTSMLATRWPLPLVRVAG